MANSSNDNGSMERLVQKIAHVIAESQSHKSKKSFSIGRSILATAAMNLISLPFGRISLSVATSRRKSKDEIARDIDSLLYSEFIQSHWGANEECAKKRSLYAAFLDSLPSDRQHAIIHLAISDRNRYESFLREWLVHQASIVVAKTADDS